MNSHTDPPPVAGPDAGDPSRSSPPPGDSSWAEAIGGLAASRAGLFRIEAGDFARVTVRRVVLAAAAAISAVFAWALIVAGAVGVIVMLSGWPWGYVLLGAAAVHMVAAFSFIAALRRPAPPAFPLTREEFQKDRAWLQTLQEKKKSHD